MDGWFGWMNGWMVGWKDEWKDGWMDERVGGWMEGWMDVSVDEWMEGWKFFLKDVFWAPESWGWPRSPSGLLLCLEMVRRSLRWTHLLGVFQ